MTLPRRAQLRFVVVGGLVLAVTAVAVVVMAIPGVRGALTEVWEHKAKASAEQKEADEGAELIRDAQGHEGLRLTDEAARGLRIEPMAVLKADKARPLPPQIGTLNFDNDRLFTIRSRFPGEVAEMRKMLDTDGSGAQTRTRPLRFGDKLKQGDLLAVVWSQPLGQAKSALVDAISQLNMSEAQLQRQFAAFYDAALSLGTLMNTERGVRGDVNSLNTAERSLRMWKLTNEEIQELKDEAKKLLDKNYKRDARAEAEKWARVEIRVPTYCDNPSAELTVVEKNTNINDMVDPINSGPLFKLADMTRLQIWVHPPEEYLPLIRDRLHTGAEPVKWEIRIQSDSPDTPPKLLPIIQVSPSLEPNQHSPMVLGYLDNPDNKYLVGQFVTATIYMPPDKDTVEMPTNALNEVEGQAMVFVQPDPGKNEIILRRVAVVQRFKDVTLVRSKLTQQEQDLSRTEVARGRRPLQPLLPGERVITRGVVELTSCLEELATKERVNALAKNNK